MGVEKNVRLGTVPNGSFHIQWNVPIRNCPQWDMNVKRNKNKGEPVMQMAVTHTHTHTHTQAI